MSNSRCRRGGLILSLCLCVSASNAISQPSQLVSVVSRPLSRTVDLPGEFLPFLSVGLHAKIPGYVERIPVDRGSVVRQGDLVADLAAPELKAQIAEAESKV